MSSEPTDEVVSEPRCVTIISPTKAFVEYDGLKYQFSRKEIETATASKSTRCSFFAKLEYLDDIPAGQALAKDILLKFTARDTCLKEIEPTIEVVHADNTIRYADLLNRSPWNGDKLILDIACTVIANKPGHEPLWLCLLAPASCGKTHLCTICTVPLITYRLSTMTASAFSPGSTSMEDIKSTYNLLEHVGGKCLIIDDMSAMLGQDRRVQAKILGEMTTMYGEFFAKASPGGVQTNTKSWNFVFGLTPDLLHSSREIMKRYGQRMLIKRWSRTDEVAIDPIPVGEWIGYLARLIDESRSRVPGFSDDLVKRLDEIANTISYIRSWSSRGVEGKLRIYKQGIAFCTTRAALYERDVNVDDIDVFMSTLLDTIPNYEILKACRGKAVKDIAIDASLAENTVKKYIPMMLKHGLIVEGEYEDSGKYYINSKFTILDPKEQPAKIRDKDESVSDAWNPDEVDEDPEEIPESHFTETKGSEEDADVEPEAEQENIE